MKKRIDAVKLQREIRSKLTEKYLKSRNKELLDLNGKFGHLKKKRVAHTNIG